MPKESASGERRVALVPDVVRRLAGAGHEVVIEPGAGDAAGIPDDEFAGAGAQLGDPWAAEVIARVAPGAAPNLKAEHVLVGFLAPLTDSEGVQAIAQTGATAFAMEAIPRISRAQSMDALSSQATVSGYLSVIIAAGEMPRFLPMLMTAAGTIPPAHVLVLGAGVAGLQALATAKRLGARTTGYDVRPEVAEQVQSLGAKWLDVGVDAAGEGGYARELTDEERAKQQQGLQDAIASFDAVITTANVPGRKAPTLVTAAAVQGMKPGSVIIDMAGESGGNCELTEPGEVVVKHDVTIVSPLNLPTTMPEHASQLYARNVQSLIELMLDDEGNLNLDFEDEIIAGACVVRDGEIVHEGAKKTVEGAAA